MNVIIDGVKYVPASSVVVNRKQILRALVELFWGDGLSDRKIEDESRDFGVRVSDSFDEEAMSVYDFVDNLSEVSK